MSEKVKKAAEKQRAAAAAAEAEKIRQQMIDEMYEEIRLEKYNFEQRALLDEQQMEMRKIQLENTWSAVHKNQEAFEKYLLDDEKEENWIWYTKCDGLPNPAVQSDMNTYFFIWSMENANFTMAHIANKCRIIIYLLIKVDELIERAKSNSTGYIEEWKVIRQRFRNKLEEGVNQACYRLLRQIERDMVRVDMKNAIYVYESAEITSCLWALIKLPISLRVVPVNDRKAIEVEFREIGISIKMPLDIDGYCMAIRGLWTIYDHISDTCSTYEMAEIPIESQLNIDLLTYCQNLYSSKQQIREDQAEEREKRLQEKKAKLEKLQNPPAVIKPDRKKKGKKQIKVKKSEPEADLEPLPYLPTPDEILLSREEDIRKALRKHLSIRSEKTEINLRKYKILGGIYHVDLFYQPPQPKDLGKRTFLTTLEIPKELKQVPFYKEYHPPAPAPDDERTPEVIEEEIKALEAAMEALALVTLKLPNTILWFEPPLVAHWMAEKKIWSTQFIHDIKFNEEQQMITFRTGRLGIHGLAANKFVNLPFQSWELKPDCGKNSKTGILLNIIGAAVQVEFIVREDTVCLSSMIGGTCSALEDIIGRYMKIKSLMRTMQSSGCDLFPERDAFCYVKGLSMKHPIMERHLQECMGLLCTGYSFSWSRWNATRSSREIVVQCKELTGSANERSSLTLLVTPVQTVEIQCSEVSQEFSDAPTDGEHAKFYSDLYHYALHKASIKTGIAMNEISFKLVRSVVSLLQLTNVISMSS
ncbi:dynein axonemal intermediate chain 7-like isoform X2 [Prorops nasuta]|uniref:dynein axonemal intermediate chain 7-like isoform X2 n=1 Tax=Prorops nasuta TaxID=863751 RepID=UPI0034CE19B0